MSENPGISLDEDLLFADNMLRLREEQGLSRADLVKVLREEGWEVHQTTIVRIERREQRVKLREASMIAKALKSTVTHMLQPEFDSQVAERLYRVRQVLQANRWKIQNGTDRWIGARDEALAALEEAEQLGVKPSGRVYDGKGEIARSTAADEAQFVLRELAQNPELTAKRAAEEAESNG